MARRPARCGRRRSPPPRPGIFRARRRPPARSPPAPGRRSCRTSRFRIASAAAGDASDEDNRGDDDDPPTERRTVMRRPASGRVSPGSRRAPPGSSARSRCSGRCGFSSAAATVASTSSARHRRALEPLDQHGRGIDEARRAVAALEAELVEEGLLHRRERERSRPCRSVWAMPSMVRMRLPSKKSAPVMQVRTSSLVWSSRSQITTQAWQMPMPQPRREPVRSEHLVQHVDHHQAFGHVHRTVAPAVDGHRERAGRRGLMPAPPGSGPA